MALEKLTITAYDSASYVSKGKECQIQINPESYSRKHKTKYDNKVALGASGASLEFQGMSPETISFDIYFDSTGAIKDSTSSVDDQISTLKEVCYEYQDEIHEPNYLIISWGSLVFKCKLTSLDLTYSLFQPDGTPLRAKVSVSFEEALDESEISKKANPKSPDLSHHVMVRQGDTLPLICHKIYGDSRYFQEVARYNKLTSYRNLKVGSIINLPSIK